MISAYPFIGWALMVYLSKSPSTSDPTRFRINLCVPGSWYRVAAFVSSFIVTKSPTPVKYNTGSPAAATGASLRGSMTMFARIVSVTHISSILLSQSTSPASARPRLAASAGATSP